MFIIFPIICLLLSFDPVAAEEHQAPIIFDVMTFDKKPDLGLSHDLSFIYEWEATLRDENIELNKIGSGKESSSRTIERDSLMSSVKQRRDYKYIVIDIESLKPEDDNLAMEYVRIAKSAADGIKVAWWNTGPRYVAKPGLRGFDARKWRDDWEKRLKLEEVNDFVIFGSYFLKSNDTMDSWAGREIPRIVEFRRRFPNKMLFVTLSPHPFLEGLPWQYISGKVLGETLDLLAKQPIDGIVLWSFEGAGRIQKWDESREWVRALRERIGRDGRYRVP